MEGVPDEVVLVNPPLLDFLDELPQAARAVPSSTAVHSVPARFQRRPHASSRLVDGPGVKKGTAGCATRTGMGLHRKGFVPSAHATLPASTHRWRVSIRSCGHAPSQGIVPERSRARMVTLCRLTSSQDQRSKAKSIDRRSRSRNSGLMWASNVNGSSGSVGVLTGSLPSFRERPDAAGSGRSRCFRRVRRWPAMTARPAA